MLDQTTHRSQMYTLLIAIFQSAAAPYLAFKWGTLAYFFRGLDRFSTDLDLDILDITKEKEIVDTLTHVLELHGNIKNETPGKHLYRFIYRYDERWHNIKIELNKRDSVSTYEYLSLWSTTIRVMTTASMFANKLLALYEREENRDVYDVYFFFRQWLPIDEQVIMIRSGLSLRDFFSELIVRLQQRFTSRYNILHKLWEVLDHKQKLRAKTHLTATVIGQIEFFITWLK